MGAEVMVPARAAPGGSDIQLSLSALSLAEVSFKIGRGVDGGILWPMVELVELSRCRDTELLVGGVLSAGK